MVITFLRTFLLNLFENYPVSFKNKILIAYSGGVDSHVLLHAIAQLRQEFPELKLKAVHIHHGLFEAANQWAQHCRQICDELKVELQIINVKVERAQGVSVEEAARAARYAALEKLLQRNDVLITAHHADDQAETCLLQFLRGAGIKGLASMPSVVNFAAGFLARPFLSISRQEILQYAQKNKLFWIEDHSNHDLNFTRNFLRYKIMPEFRKRWPNINKTIMRVANNCSDANELLKDLAVQDIKKLKGQVKNTLSISKLKKLSFRRQKNVLREWIDAQNFRLPSAIKLQHIVNDVINARTDATPCIAWGEAEIRSYQDDLYIMRSLSEFNYGVTLPWDGKSSLKLPNDLGVLQVEKVVGQGLKSEILKRKLEIKFRQGGEQCKLLGREGTHKLKKLFQEWKVPPWQRDRVPLLYVDNQLAAIVGYAVCLEFIPDAEEIGVVIKLATLL
ncbi:MAG: tRNA lysidine(34) synthetase TilS [Gammaproteobacteria bacterium]|jgi:tRNA(Ile)-lysidine synthase